MSVHRTTEVLFTRTGTLAYVELCSGVCVQSQLCGTPIKSWKKAVLLTFVSMYFAELLCLHFLVFTGCKDVKSTMLWGKGQGLLQIIIERKKKMQRNVRRSWWTCFCGNWKRDQATKLRTRSRFHILQPHPWGDEKFRAEIPQVWMKFLVFNPSLHSLVTLITSSEMSVGQHLYVVVVSEQNKRVCNQIRHKCDFFLFFSIAWMHCLKQAKYYWVAYKNIVRCFLLLNSH